MSGPQDPPAQNPAAQHPAESNPLRVELTSTPDLTVLHLAGELTSRVAHLLEEALSAIAAGGWPSRLVVLDLVHVDFVDLSSVHVLEAGRHRLAESQIGLVLREPPTMLRELLDITGWHERFTIQ